MKLIFCIDKKKGMMLFGKRQSQDRVLIEKLLELTAGAKLWVSTYTAKQFEADAPVCIDDDYINKAGENDYCFIENLGYDLAKTDEIVLCHWNRQYQADAFFCIDLTENGFQKQSSTDIAGSSHKKITIEVYKRG